MLDVVYPMHDAGCRPRRPCDQQLVKEYYGPGQPNDYERVWVHDALRPEREGWIYVWNDSCGCAPIREGSWRAYVKKKS